MALQPAPLPVPISTLPAMPLVGRVLTVATIDSDEPVRANQVPSAGTVKTTAASSNGRSTVPLAAFAALSMACSVIVLVPPPEPTDRGMAKCHLPSPGMKTPVIAAGAPA